MPWRAAGPGRFTRERILEVVRRYWGHGELREMQEEAIRAGLERRDSLVVMPTGGGKSLCYQAPPLLLDRPAVVVSPLISLMKDQVDGLRAMGYPAAALNSELDPAEQGRVEAAFLAGEHRLLYVSPERLLTARFLGLCQRLGIDSFAIDEAHCISQWGHDFRPEYRRLAELKQRFPGCAVHAYTATATERVRRDIVEQLRLEDPAVLVGRFDRPNLVYRVVPRTDALAQTLEIVRRHAGAGGAETGEAVIVYCISRAETERLAEGLRRHGVAAGAYHAGLEHGRRRRIQEDFANERLNVVVATVAFGMGIDRSNVRCVVHAAMPKSLEAYQQESGRAGRDGLEAECVLLYAPADAARWASLLRQQAAAGGEPEALEASLELVRGVQRYGSAVVCRHRALSEYFGQAYERASCGACDVCLGEVRTTPEALVLAQKILSCVARCGGRFGAGHIADVLVGSGSQRLRSFGHERLSTYGLLRDLGRREVLGYVYQLVDQGLLDRTDDEWPVLRLNERSWEVMRGQREVMLFEPKRAVKKSRAEGADWKHADRGLFEALRALRRRIAQEREVPPYVVFSDATLRELAAVRPSSRRAMLGVRGVGGHRLREFGEAFLEAIREYCEAHGLELDNVAGARFA